MAGLQDILIDRDALKADPVNVMTKFMAKYHAGQLQSKNSSMFNIEDKFSQRNN